MSSPPPQVSVVVPVRDEEGAVAPLAREIASAFEGDGLAYEMIFVDDASEDRTRPILKALKAELPALRVIGHAINAGQSRAVRSGVAAARGAVIVTLDGDGQNDPTDAPRLARRLLGGPEDLALVGGRRLKRRDSAAKRYASSFANSVRKRLLHDGADDTGCGLKAFRRDAFMGLPYFDHMHRYIPALMQRDGWSVAFEDVSHRPRLTGASKYNNFGRLLDSLTDLSGMIWLRRRARSPGRPVEL